MEGSTSENTASATTVPSDIPLAETRDKTLMGMTEKLGIRDEHAGERIKDAADRTGAVVGIGAILLGVLIWCRTQDIQSFLIGLLIAVGGLVISYMLVCVLYSYGDMITMSIEQAQILKRLETKKISELISASTAERKVDAGKKTISAETTAVSSEEARPIPAAADEEVKKPNAAAPGTAVFVDRVNRIARFANSYETDLTCPICGRKQLSAGDECFYCGCKFICDDEKTVSRNKVTLDLLRHMSA